MSAGPVLIGIPGAHLEESDRASLAHPAVGGVVLFARNIESREQVCGLVRDIRNACEPRPLVCVDQEGGRVQRLQEGFTRLPPLGFLGKLAQSDSQKAQDMAYRHGRVMATEMLDCGIDLSFAPVLDLDRGSSIIGDRAFSSNPSDVVRLGRAYLAGMRDSGMRTTGKHFPGHGSIAADSHVADVVDSRAFDQIAHSDLLPFGKLASELDAMMIAHVTYPQVDSVPAGYSQTWLKKVLRGDMAYRGVTLSDDLGMHAARSVGGLQERAKLSLDAGCDLVLVCEPSDVIDLLGSWPRKTRDAGDTIARLYGHPTVSPEELASVDREGIKEWSRWRQSLEELGRQAWA